MILIAKKNHQKIIVRLRSRIQKNYLDLNRKFKKMCFQRKLVLDFQEKLEKTNIYQGHIQKKI